MKRCFPQMRSLAFLAALTAPMVLWGQNQAEPTNSDSTQTDQTDPSDQSGLGAYLLRTFKLTGSIRARWEGPEGAFTVTPADSYMCTQLRLGVLFQPVSWLRAFVEAQDARAEFYRAPLTNAIYDPVDLHLAWVGLGNPEGPGAFVKIGRQDMVIGSGHLLASIDAWWLYTARNFDVAHGTFTTKYFKTELVAGSAVLINTTGFDEHRPGDHVYADYNSFDRLLPGASVEPYLIVRTLNNVKSKEGQLGNMDTLAVGARIIGKIPGGFDYNFEPLHEFGGYSNDRLNATGLLTGAGWTISSSGWKPRVSTDYEYASGDDAKKDHSRETFDNMFGFNWPMNSITGQFAWKNLKDLRAGVEFTPFKKLTFKVDWRDLWLANINDGLYNAVGTRTVFNPSATSAHIGESVEMMATATLTKHTSFGFGVGTIFPGEYLKESKKDQPYIYPYVSFTQTF